MSSLEQAQTNLTLPPPSGGGINHGVDVDTRPIELAQLVLECGADIDLDGLANSLVGSKSQDKSPSNLDSRSLVFHRSHSPYFELISYLRQGRSRCPADRSCNAKVVVSSMFLCHLLRLSLSPEPISKAQTADLRGITDTSGTPPKQQQQQSAESSTSPTPQREVTTVKPLRGVRINPEERQWHATVVHGRGVLEPYRHPRTHGVPVAFIQFRAHSPGPIQLAAHFASHAAASLGIPISGVVSLPDAAHAVDRPPWRTLSGACTRAIKAFDADAEVVDRWVRYLEAHAPPGVGRDAHLRGESDAAWRANGQAESEGAGSQDHGGGNPGSEAE
ncbi:hypothetical protein EDB89DRAFT_2242442 [Lactarius sanguifluus]|nr:hypothetical protein EDB89DRAFT_2242442 [Lactarius sanguifluus]